MPAWEALAGKLLPLVLWAGALWGVAMFALYAGGP